MARRAVRAVQFLRVGAKFAPEIQFDSVPNFIKLPPDMHLGEVAGVAINSKGHIFVYSRGGSIGPAFGNTASQILELDHDGSFIREVGKNLYAWAFAHTVRIDKDDNIWATDKGSDMVVKFNPGRSGTHGVWPQDGSVRLEAKAHEHPQSAAARRRMVASASRPTWPGIAQVTRYISDGYINSRVAKVSKDGDWLKSWGEGQGRGQFDTPHTIAIDRKTISMSVTAAIAASRYSTTTATSEPNSDRFAAAAGR